MKNILVFSGIFALVTVFAFITMSCGPVVMKEISFNITNQNDKNVTDVIIHETESGITHELNIDIPAGAYNDFSVYVMRDLRNNDSRVEVDISFKLADGSNTDRLVVKADSIIFLVINSSAQISLAE